MRRKQTILFYLAIPLMISFPSCMDEWEEYYEPGEEQVNMKMWDAIRQEPRFSLFVSKMEELFMDSIFREDLTYTLFIPANGAFETIVDTNQIMDQILSYHISPTLFLSTGVAASRKLQTFLGKFALIEAGYNGYTYDGIAIEYTSPLYLDGKYYELAGVAYPRPNLYEFTALYSNIIKAYIDSRDSVYLDRSESKPIGFDPDGNTIYDSAFGVVNLFEKKYFPVSEEFRDRSATMILFTQEQYLEALDEMAVKLGLPGGDHEEIPAEWQYEVLLPASMQNAMFDGMLTYTDLMADTLQSITGDTVVIDHENIDPGFRFTCSNGVTFLYSRFTISDTLYLGSHRIEGEELVDSVGAGKWAWKDEVSVSGAIAEPEKLLSSSASEGALVNVVLPRNYAGEYRVEFSFRNVLPMRYRLVWRANSRPSGLFAIYVNDEKIAEFDNNLLRSTILSVTGQYFIPDNGFNRKDFWIENISSFGDVSLRFEYLGPGKQSNNGLNIDYVELISSPL